MEESRDSLEKISGIQNQEVLDRLVTLDVRPEMLATLCVVPLVEIAWADGTLDQKEKDAILTAAQQENWLKESPDYALLEEWLQTRPGPELLEAWILYTHGICEKMTPEQREDMKQEVLRHTRHVAEAGGGILGLIQKVSAAEVKMLAKLEKAFD